MTNGAVLSTMNDVLGPAGEARLPALSVAVPPATEIPIVPSPAMLDRVTVQLVPEPLMSKEAVAVPVVLRVMSCGESVLTLKFVST